MKYKIYEYEISRITKVEAGGVVEAMFEIIPWSSLGLDVDYHPSNGTAFVVDKTTDFKYRVEW